MIALILSSFFTLAPADTLVIQGKEVQFSDPTYRPGINGESVIHSVKLNDPTVFEFKTPDSNNSNFLKLEGELTLFDNRNIWIANGLKGGDVISWKTKWNEWSLNCNERPVVNGLILPQRMIYFHKNGQYLRGCDSFIEMPITLQDNRGEVIVSQFAAIDLHSSGKLAYAAKIERGNILIGDKKVELTPKSEVAFYPDGQIHFFTPKAQTQITVSSVLGPIRIQQFESPLVSVSLFQNGYLERARLGSDLNLNGILIPKGSAVLFEEAYLSASKFSKPITLEIDGYRIKATQALFWENHSPSSIEVAEEFIFITPDEARIEIPVPVGSKISMSRSGKIAHIEVPAR